MSGADQNRGAQSAAADRIAPFKRAAGRFASGVTIVTTRNQRHVSGITCSSFVSLSLNPLLISVSVHAASPFLAEVRSAGSFAVSVLASDQQHVSRYFSTRGRGRAVERFPTVRTDVMDTGAPVVHSCLSWFDARLHTVLPGGDHQILVGEVVAAGGADGAPLLYWAGDYRELDGGRELRGGPGLRGGPELGEGMGPAAVSPDEERVERFADAIAVQLHLNGLSSSQLLEAQETLEPAAAELAARRGLPDGLAALEDALAASRAVAGDLERFTEVAGQFHDALGMATGNPAFAASLLALSRSRHAHYASGTTAPAVRRTLRAHEEILAAIRAADPSAARERVVEHLRVVERRLCQPIPAPAP
jgi:flavin reductase (DIM6/NTAB) family NADH-FMN oxidoreductase RutF